MKRGGMRIAVTGGAGFVGSQLAQQLVAAGYDVHLLLRATSDAWRIQDWRHSVSVYEADLRDRSAVHTAIARIRPEAVIHAAAHGTFSFQRATADIVSSNLQGTIHLIEACEQVPFPLFVQLGSSSEYGCKQQPMAERDCLEPVTDYAVSKAAATLYSLSRAKRDRLPIVSLRLFSPYGPFDAGSRLVASTIVQALRGTSPSIAYPDAVRDYIHIDDVASLVVHLLQQRAWPFAGDVFNVGSGVQRRIRDVVDDICRVAGGAVQPRYAESAVPAAESNPWVADTAKTRAQLQWSPAMSWETGIRRTVDWFAHNLHRYS